MDFNSILNFSEYFSLADLRYNDKLSFHMSAADVSDFLDYKDKLLSEGSERFICLGLKSFNSKYIFYADHSCLRNFFDEYMQLVNSEDVFESGFDEMRKARIYSELEGSLKIEGYNSTRLIFDRLMSGAAPANENEIRIKNMANAMAFVEAAPAFTKDNLFKLYSILSDGCLKDEQKLRPGALYRYDMVYISTYNGAPVDALDSCMDSLFKFVNDAVKSEDALLRFLLPHIVHYYLVYIHPYFDCNGRTARMASLWVANLTGIGGSPYFISEAINDNKAGYYKAINRSRDSRNDLTYFLLFILKTSISYALCYRKLNTLHRNLAQTGDSMTSAEYGYLKKIILSFDKRYFTWKDFVDCTGTGMTKQGALKTLNRLESDGLLESGTNKKREKIFREN